ncbi:MAG: DUF4870 domain-containing protein [Chitinophagaceae bacterium]|nr:DUF4870 domain-containing protein [Chitinophagaceae bacterium]
MENSNSKSSAVINYITIFGWLYVYITSKEKDNFLKYHQRQSFGLFITGFVICIALNILAMILPVLGIVGGIIGLLSLLLMIVGIINANNGVEKPLPIIGKMFENKFSFIS